jgi:ATP-dependent Clp protease ATP-binding subunit ClpC
MGYHLELSNEAKDFIADKGYDVQFGARPLKRAIQRYLEDELADVVLSGELNEGDTILMELITETSEIKAKIVKPVSE